MSNKLDFLQMTSVLIMSTSTNIKSKLLLSLVITMGTMALKVWDSLILEWQLQVLRIMSHDEREETMTHLMSSSYVWTFLLDTLVICSL